MLLRVFLLRFFVFCCVALMKGIFLARLGFPALTKMSVLVRPVVVRFFLLAGLNRWI